MKNKIEILLYESLDGKLSAKEKQLLDDALLNSPELREMREQLLKLRSKVKDSADTSFKPFFEERLINKINSASSGTVNIFWADSIFVSFRQIAVAAMVLLILLVAYNLNNGNVTLMENLIGTYSTPIEYALDPAYQILGSGL